MNKYETGWLDGGLREAINEEPAEINPEFAFGTFTAGFVAGQSDRSAGYGLMLAVDVEAPHPGFHAVVGPFGVWWRRNFPLVLSFLHLHMITLGRR